MRIVVHNSYWKKEGWKQYCHKTMVSEYCWHWCPLFFLFCTRDGKLDYIETRCGTQACRYEIKKTDNTKREDYDEED